MKRSLNYNQDWGSIFYYDETSVSCLRWNINAGRGRNQVWIGKDAGSTDKRGRWLVGYKGKVYTVSVIVWALFNDLHDGFVIDHIDHNPSNNKLENLRQVTQKTNTRNKIKQSNNTSGITGVSYHKRDNYWSVTYTKEGKLQFERFYLKHHSDAKEQAIKRRLEIEKELIEKYGYSDTHGKDNQNAN